MARVEQTRFLLLSQSMKAEAGLWYVFFMPGVIEKVVTGTIWHGFKSRPGLAIHYWPEERPDKEDVFYLGFPDVESLQRVRADIQIDAPAKAFETA